MRPSDVHHYEYKLSTNTREEMEIYREDKDECLSFQCAAILLTEHDSKHN